MAIPKFARQGKMTEWKNVAQVGGETLTCGFCGHLVGPSFGYVYSNSSRYILICPTCDRPNFFEARIQTPAPLLGNTVENVPKEIDNLYNEARACTGVGAFTAAVMACRKILMHLAVDKGAEKGKRFIEYVEYLSDNHYVPPGGKDWVDHIRSKGNEANHEITIMSKEDALDLIRFSEMLLKFIYEFPMRIPPKPTT
jgi:transcription elongation factor Elf1